MWQNTDAYGCCSNSTDNINYKATDLNSIQTALQQQQQQLQHDSISFNEGLKATNLNEIGTQALQSGIYLNK